MTGIIEVACGTNHTVFLRKRGGDEPGADVWASGLGNQGHLGITGDGDGVNTAQDMFYQNQLESHGFLIHSSLRQQIRSWVVFWKILVRL